MTASWTFHPIGDGEKQFFTCQWKGCKRPASWLGTKTHTYKNRGYGGGTRVGRVPKYLCEYCRQGIVRGRGPDHPNG